MPPSLIVISSESEKSFSFAVKKGCEERDHGKHRTPNDFIPLHAANLRFSPSFQRKEGEKRSAFIKCGEAATISHFSFRPSFHPRSRGGTPQGLTLFLSILLSGNKDRIAAETPVFQRHFIDGDDSRSRIFVQDIGQKIRDTTDERSFLLGGHMAFSGDFDIDVWHSGLL